MVEETEKDRQSTDVVMVFGAASFMNDMGSDLIAPIWPTFLTNRVGLDIFQVGVVDGLALTVTALSKLGAGYVSDRSRKRKIFINVGYLLSVIGRIGFLFSYAFYQIATWKSLDRLGKMRGPPRDAIVAEETTKEKRGRAFGVLRALDTSGAVVGAFISYLLFSFLGYEGIILLAVFPGIGSVILISVFIKEKKGKDVFKGVTFRGLNHNLKLFLLASTLLALATYSYSFLIIFSEGFGFGEETVPILYLFFTIVHAVSTYPFGRLSDSVGRKSVLLLGFGFLLLTSLMTNFVTNWLTVFLLFLFFGLMNGVLEPVQTSFISDLVEKERRASILGAFQLVVGLSALPAGAIMGYLWENVNTLAAFQYSIVICALAMIVLSMIKVRESDFPK